MRAGRNAGRGWCASLRPRACCLPCSAIWLALIVAGVIMQLLGRLVPKDMASNMPFLGYVGLNAHTGAFAVAVATVGRGAAGRYTDGAAFVSKGA